MILKSSTNPALNNDILSLVNLSLMACRSLSTIAPARCCTAVRKAFSFACSTVEPSPETRMYLLSATAIFVNKKHVSTQSSCSMFSCRIFYAMFRLHFRYLYPSE